MPMPTKRHDDVEEEILKAISEGTPLATICRSNPARYPHPTTWGDWCEKDESLAIAYARAREVGFDAIAADGLKIVDDTSEDPASRRVRADYRLKLLAKWDPKRYGDAMLHKHADADGEKMRLGEVEQLTRIAALASKLQERLGDTDNSE